MWVGLKEPRGTSVVDKAPQDFRTDPRGRNRYEVVRKGDVVEVRIGRNRSAQAIIPTRDGGVNGGALLDSASLVSPSPELVNQLGHVSHVRIPPSIPLPVKQEMRPPAFAGAPTQVVVQGIHSGCGDVGIAVKIERRVEKP